MSKLKNRLLQLAAGLEQSFDELLLKAKQRWNLSDPLQIVAYRSYGTVDRLYVKGRVLEDKGLSRPSDKDSLLDNLLSMYQRFESDEVPGAKLQLTFQGQKHEVLTDSEGYFVLNLVPTTPIQWEDMWHEIDLELVQAPLPFAKGLKQTAEVLVPPADAEYGIISDIDDTIIKTGATDLLAMSRNTFFHNAKSRLPFAGVSEFYKALQLGRNGKRNNPFFYVSSSPWNLYDLLIDFLDINQIPEGPLLLRDYGLNKDKISGTGHMGHKMKEIEQILAAYPRLKFVLIGDSGQEDASIYREVVRKFPNRILVVYIRDVQLSDREELAMDIAKELAADRVEMVIIDNTVEAAEHAAKIGLIYTEAIPEIVEEKKQDKGELPGKEKI